MLLEDACRQVLEAADVIHGTALAVSALDDDSPGTRSVALLLEYAAQMLEGARAAICRAEAGEGRR